MSSDDSIVLQSYSYEWPQLALQEISAIRAKLPKSTDWKIEHIGSTSIPGISAKPIIDIAVEVPKIANGALAVEPLESMGYSYWRDNPDTQHMFFVKGLPPAGSGRTHHVHFFEPARFYEYICFRDRLRKNSDLAEKYENLKHELARKFKSDREGYTKAKALFIRSVIDERDPIFENSRLVEIYDGLDGKRGDLDHYVAIAKELKAHSILDVGSGTGCFALLAVDHGFQVTGVEPALGSLDWARKKPKADNVSWIHADTSRLPDLKVDLAVMTGNVAQVFLTDEHWETNLIAIRKALNTKGHLVFEVRDPAQKAWLEWNRAKTYRRVNIPKVGYVDQWNELINVSGELVSFRWTYVFESDGAIIKSDSTLRFREKASIERSLVKCGYKVKEVRGAPDRPSKEFVFIATPV